MFHWVDWLVLAAYIAGTSWLADRLAGKKQTIRDFFLGGRKLPWQAVCGSIVASEVSGVTFVSVPAIAYGITGNYTYLMLATGTIAARFIIGWFLVPAYYRQEIYSPYEFMGRRLGPAVDRAATVLFFVGGFLAQGARLFLAAMVLDVITDMGLVPAILLLAAISVVWTWMGGIASVVWTDVVQFAILFGGGILLLVAVILVVPGGWEEIVRGGSAAGKFRLWNLTRDPSVAYTLWAGLCGSTFLTLASHGTDQMMAQRLFCCRDANDARKAVVWSSISQFLPLLMLTVGVGIYVFYQHVAKSPLEAALYAKHRDNLLPAFILERMPLGVKGLLFAAIFSAATATSTLSAMAQTALSSFYLPFVKSRDERRLVFVSRIFVLIAAAGLSATAVLCSRIKEYPAILDLALAMAGYSYGALLGMLLLALLPPGRDGRGLFWGVPCSMLVVFALSWSHLEWARVGVLTAVSLLAASSLYVLRKEWPRLLWVVVGIELVLAATYAVPVKLAYPWHYPIGAAVTLLLGVALGRKKDSAPEPAPLS